MEVKLGMGYTSKGGRYSTGKSRRVMEEFIYTAIRVNRRKFMENNFTLEGSASIVAGPLRRSFSADTDYKFKASTYSYSISKGAYIGVSFQG